MLAVICWQRLACCFVRFLGPFAKHGKLQATPSQRRQPLSLYSAVQFAVRLKVLLECRVPPARLAVHRTGMWAMRLGNEADKGWVAMAAPLSTQA